MSQICRTLLQGVALNLVLLALMLAVSPPWAETGEDMQALFFLGLAVAVAARLVPGGPRRLTRALALGPLCAVSLLSAELLQLPSHQRWLMLVVWLLPAVWGCWKHGSLRWASPFGWSALLMLPFADGILRWIARSSVGKDEIQLATNSEVLAPTVVAAVLLDLALAFNFACASFQNSQSRDEASLEELIRVEPDSDFGAVRRAR